MRFNFLELKRQRDYTVFLLLLILWFSYSLSIFVLTLLFRALFISSGRSHRLDAGGADEADPLILAFDWTVHHWKLWLFLGFAVALVFWLYSAMTSKDKVLTMFRAYPPDESDRYHRVFSNIIEEVKIASGIKKISPVIVPDTDINAFACEGMDGSVAIGVTEGAVAQLNRQELEAVVAHEMGHVMAGDLVSSTMFTGIMTFYSMMMQMGRSFLRASNYRGANAGSGVGAVLYLVGGLWYVVNSLLILAISRQREYRADLLAVKIVRDPESLARALLKIDRNCKSMRIIKDKFMGSLFISNPFQPTEEEDVFSSLGSTHPPIRSRINVLCNIAGVSVEDLERKIVEEDKAQRRPMGGLVWLEPVEETEGEEGGWFVFRGGQWEGPFGLNELLGLGLGMDDFVRKEGGEAALVQDVPELVSLFRGAPDKEEVPNSENKGRKMVCPRCESALKLADYEGTRVYACPSCYGILADLNAIRKILVRQEVGFSEDVVRWGDKLLEMGKSGDVSYKKEKSFVCPFCGEVRACPTCPIVSLMDKRFVSNRLPVEIDMCPRCGRVWFDHRELEVLQYMVEKLVRETGSSFKEVLDLYVGVV